MKNSSHLQNSKQISECLWVGGSGMVEKSDTHYIIKIFIIYYIYVLDYNNSLFETGKFT